ncbi:hypothetical protein BCY91_11145 [Pelobium manganitolerans]|uniref:Secretion system C-terminal sorting domain-containing protein n=1 Tax=Pelobium manganitolerans TaxID=1842495 RepID=A0A419S262_9SPHI|nr:T9SS type A sorting domain-containing protein [Pelobium manganitolerans]RKD12797.1 hypothetical protein BCY91_11145 [Pelobium manganitolerans]
MKRSLLSVALFALSSVFVYAQPAPSVGEVPFTPGNLAIYRFTKSAVNNGIAPGFIDEITPEGVLVRSIPLPTATDGANRRMMAGLFGQAREGLMDLSADGRFLTVFGLDGPADGLDYANYPKVIGTVSGNGKVNTTTAIKTDDVGNVGRQVTSADGSGFYTVGTQGGVRYVPLGFNSGVSAIADFESSPGLGGNGANFALKIFNSKLYISAGTGSSSSLAGVIGKKSDNLPTPTTDASTGYTDFQLPDLVQPNDFVLFDTNSDGTPDLIYVLDVATGANTIIRKYSYGEIVPGVGNWSALGNYTHAKLKDAKAITGRISGTDAQLFITTAPSGGAPTVARLNDPVSANMSGTTYTSAQPATDFNASKQITTILYASTSYTPVSASVNFRGIAFAPKPFTVTPVKMTSFSGKANNNSVELSWVTASENNNSHFDILRSVNGKEFSKLGTVSGNGNSAQVRNYNYVDKFPADGVNYYQLNQVDFDGSSEKSAPIAVNFGLNGKSINAYFVSDSEIQLGVFSEVNTLGQVKLVGLNGQIVWSDEVTLHDSNNSITLRPGNIAPGMYVLTLTADNEVKTVKIVK